jgi:hypothetical protein
VRVRPVSVRSQVVGPAVVSTEAEDQTPGRIVGRVASADPSDGRAARYAGSVLHSVGRAAAADSADPPTVVELGDPGRLGAPSALDRRVVGQGYYSPG